MHLWDYWAVVMKRLYLVVLFVGASLFVAWLITENQEPLYRATATVKILPPESGASSAYAPVFLTDDRYLDTMVEELRMPGTIERAVRSQKLAQQRDFQGKSEGDIVRMAAGRVEVALRRNKLLMDVSVTGPDARVLPHLANALVSEFREMQRSESRARRELARSDLESKIGRLRNQNTLLTTDKRVRLESKKYSEFTFESDYKREQKRLEDYTFERDRVSRELARDRKFQQTFKAARERQGDWIAAVSEIPEVRQTAEFQKFETQIAELRDELARMERGGFGPGSEEYQKIEAETGKVRAQRDRWVQNYVDGYLLSYQAREEQLMDLDRELSAISAKVEEIVNLKGEIDQFNLEIDEAKQEIALLQKQLDPILLSAFDDRDSVSITQAAREPTEPYSPNRGANLTLGAIIGVLGGVALAFLLDYLDDTIRTKDELAKIADVPLLGIVPNIEGRGSDTSKKDLFAHHQPKSTISEAYRGVRTALTLSAQGPMQKVLLLTSAGPREGKTTTAINLATVLAYSGGRTLVVDADLRKPRIHKSFGLTNTRGLTNLIIGHDDPVEYCQTTAVERVDVLPSGPIPPNPSELLGHPRMREILARLRGVYDHVIVDTPPIGAVTDAAVLATVVDGVILVVHAGKTRRQIVMRGIEQLRYINARIVGVILNNLRMGRVRYYPGYYHYYYYYSSQYGAEEAPPAEPKAKAGREGSGGGESA
jgi:capsular exopolysaccharide synthesis family protein